jgi:polysaccharide export outer membrane protein
MLKHVLLVLLLLAVGIASGQQLSPVAATDAKTAPPSVATDTAATDYVLGPGDQISVIVPDLDDEFTGKTFRIDVSGDLTLPYAGHFRAAGMTASDLETELRERLTLFLNKPQVVVIIAAYGSQPVSVLGAVKTPGILQIAGRKTLFETLSLAGGLTPDAGYLIHISRDAKWGPIPLPDAVTDPSGMFSTATVKVKDIMDSTNTASNVLIYPGDKISIPTAEVVYAVGSVNRPGGFPLHEHESLTALQIVALAQGLDRAAASNRAVILRPIDGSSERSEIPVNLKKIMGGNGNDLALRAGDILFVPSNKAKSIGYRTVDAIVGASGAALFVAK